jgi:transcriptional regulator with XRE-family HTH domain
MASNVHPLTRARLDRALTLRQFAKDVGVQPSTVVDWTKGRRKPQPRHLKQLSKALRMSVKRINDMFMASAA